MADDGREGYQPDDAADDRDDNEADPEHQPNGGRSSSRRSDLREPPPHHAEHDGADTHGKGDGEQDPEPRDIGRLLNRAAPRKEALEGCIILFLENEHAYPEIERAAREDVRPYTDDDGARYATQWDWVEEHLPEEPCWFLEVIGVDPARQGLGLGTALIHHGLQVAREEGLPAFLETANPRNVAYNERFGLHVVEEGDAPGGGPHFWFMRLDLAAR